MAAQTWRNVPVKCFKICLEYKITTVGFSYSKNCYVCPNSLFSNQTVKWVEPNRDGVCIPEIRITEKWFSKAGHIWWFITALISPTPLPNFKKSSNMYGKYLERNLRKKLSYSRQSHFLYWFRICPEPSLLPRSRHIPIYSKLWL